VEQINKKESEVGAIKNDVERENQKAKELYGSVKTAAGKVSKYSYLNLDVFKAIILLSYNNR